MCLCVRERVCVRERGETESLSMYTVSDEFVCLCRLSVTGLELRAQPRLALNFESSCCRSEELELQGL